MNWDDLHNSIPYTSTLAGLRDSSSTKCRTVRPILACESRSLGTTNSTLTRRVATMRLTSHRQSWATNAVVGPDLQAVRVAAAQAMAQRIGPLG
jgi:hypothetical protein